MSKYGPNENLTLTRYDLRSYKQQGKGKYKQQGKGKSSGGYLRFYCPVHGSDSQRSLSLDPDSGRFLCFQCGCWGYLKEHRERWKEEQTSSPESPGVARQNFSRRSAHPRRRKRRSANKQRGGRQKTPSSQVASEGLSEKALRRKLVNFRNALPDSRAAGYVASRGLSADLLCRYGCGYARPGAWLNRSRRWKKGRVVFPQTTPGGTLVSLYGRAVAAEGAKPPRSRRHDKLPVPPYQSGYFNAPATAATRTDEPLVVCEGPFDAASIIAAGHERTVAIFGVGYWRWDWIKEGTRLVFALDADEPGRCEARQFAAEAALRGYKSYVLPAACYGDAEDASAALQSGTLDLSELSALSLS